MADANFKLGRYRADGRTFIGRPDGNFLHVVSESDELPRALASRESATASIRRVPLTRAELLAPVDPAARIFAIAINYVAHGAESKFPPPSRPLIFYKAPSNFVAHGGTLDPNRHVTSKFDYEGEVGVVIGKNCRNATVGNALDFVAGVCALNDGSARDIGKVTLGPDVPGAAFWPDWTAGKSLDAASAVGPTITCGENILRALRERTLRISTRLNGETVQDECISEMVFSTEQIIATLSSYMTLLPGDIIATGTPAGVGAARNSFLKTGDALEFQVSGLDALCVKVG
jgi:2-keto-4-pentenoate hydratase/2-oxohepta-3-ene-1,7-dioic acid hydratase in catechol pathway